LDGYYVQRVLPSAVLHHVLRLLAIPPTKPVIVWSFGLLNAALLALTAYIWCRVADQLGVGGRGRWLGFVGLFVNYAVLKMAAYYPVLTDIPAFAVGMLMLSCYLGRRHLALAAVTALGSFVWPTLFYQGALFLLFPRDRADAEGCRPAPYRL